MRMRFDLPDAPIGTVAGGGQGLLAGRRRRS
jgi:hypothetical protein